MAKRLQEADLTRKFAIAATDLNTIGNRAGGVELRLGVVAPGPFTR